MRDLGVFSSTSWAAAQAEVAADEAARKRAKHERRAAKELFQHVHVFVPESVAAGGKFRIAMVSTEGERRLFRVRVPAGHVQGQTLKVELPDTVKAFYEAA